MKLWQIGVGLFFLMNPVIGVHDILPDFIGCFLIIMGIRDAAYMIEKLESARRFFMYAAGISIVRFAVSFLNVDRYHTLPLTLAFIFAVVELIVYIPAIRYMFAGFDYAAMRHGGSGILSYGRKMGFYNDEFGVRQYGEVQIDTTGRIAASLSRFIILRAVVSVIPELPALQLSESENVGDVTAFQFSSISTLIRFVCVVIVIIPAIIVFVKYVRFLLRVHKAGDFIPRVYDELEHRFGDLRELHTCSRMKNMSLIAGAAVLLYMGFYDYQINIIPRYVPAAMLIVASVLLAASDKHTLSLFPVIPAVCTAFISVKVFELQKDHYAFYKQQMMDLFNSDAQYIPDRHINTVDEEYMRMAFAESAEAIVLGIGIVIFLGLYIKLCIRHTREFASIPERDREPLKKSLKIRGGFMIGAAGLSTLYFTAYRSILPYFHLSSIVGILVNILSVGMFAAFALQANQYVYGNNYEI